MTTAIRDTQPVVDSMLARVRPLGLSAFDGSAPVTPMVRYVALFEEIGPIPLERLSGDGASFPWTGRAVVCAGTREGLRDAVALVRGAYRMWRPLGFPASTPLVEIQTGPVLTDGPAEDVRHSQTLVYRTTLTLFETV
ncbi:MAG: hypothetical protein IPM11_01070 [Micropruina sp.]|nr:hypothetical protein [Micropruina sp.]